MACLTPGLHENVPLGVYHSDPGISNSGLALFAQSPFHYWAYKLGALRPADEPTPQMVLGSALHCSVLEPERFRSEYVTTPGFNRRTTEGKAQERAFELEHAGKTILTPEESEAVSAMAAALLQHPAAHYLKGAKSEVTLVWNDERTGALCRARPDAWGGDAVVDIKTVRDASPEAFAKSVYSYRYHVQREMYLDGIKAVTGQVLRAFLFLVVENTYPYATAAYTLGGTFLDIGRLQYRADLDRYAACLAANTWPSYGWSDAHKAHLIQELEAPRWAKVKA